jgi:hypothetical protein
MQSRYSQDLQKRVDFAEVPQQALSSATVLLVIEEVFSERDRTFLNPSKEMQGITLSDTFRLSDI